MNERRKISTGLWTLGGLGIAVLAIVAAPAVFSPAQERTTDEPRPSRSAPQGSASDRIQELERKIEKLEHTVQEQSKRLSEKGKSEPARVAVMNLARALKEYKKTAATQDEIKEIAKNYEVSLKSLSEKVQSIQNNLPQDEDKKEAAAEELRKLQRHLQDRTEERNTAITRRTNEAMKTLFKDVEEAAATLARARSFEVVLYYNDAPDAESKYKPEVLRMKLGSSGMPIYTAEGLDITDDVIKALNHGHKPHETPVDSDP